MSALCVTPTRRTVESAVQSPVEVRAELRRACRGGSRVGAHHEQRPRRQPGQTVRHQVPQASLHRGAHDGGTHSPGDDEADPGGRQGLHGRISLGREQVHGKERTTGPPPATDRSREVVASAHPVRGGQHARDLRPRARRDPCGDAQREWHGRRGCACAGGTRGSSPDGGCSAGRCACSRGSLLMTGWTRPRRGVRFGHHGTPATRATGSGTYRVLELARACDSGRHRGDTPTVRPRTRPGQTAGAGRPPSESTAVNPPGSRTVMRAGRATRR